MDNEQLKMILETLSGAGVGAWWVAIAYIVVGYLEVLTICIALALPIWKLVRLLVCYASIAGQLEKLVGSLSTDEESSKRRRLLVVVEEHRDKIRFGK